MKDKSHLANLIAFYNESAGYSDNEGEADTTDPDFSTAFEIISHSTFTHELRKYGMKELAVRCTVRGHITTAYSYSKGVYK